MNRSEQERLDQFELFFDELRRQKATLPQEGLSSAESSIECGLGLSQQQVDEIRADIASEPIYNGDCSTDYAWDTGGYQA